MRAPQDGHDKRMLAPDPDRARLFGDEAERYHRTRPGYPDELIDEVLGVWPQQVSVLDVGCGTGYSSAVLARLASSVVALEVRMQELFGRPAAVPRVADPTACRRAAGSSHE